MKKIIRNIRISCLSVIYSLLISEFSFAQMHSDELTPSENINYIKTSYNPEALLGPKKWQSKMGGKALVKKDEINPRISFIFGAGPSYALNTIYQEPVIDKVSNTVKISRQSKLNTNLALGIVYTPFLYTIGDDTENAYALGFSYALFISPNTLSTIGNNLGVANTDVGLGLGWRTIGGFSFFIVTDFYVVRQPRSYFINQFGQNNQTFTINGQVQSAIDSNDSSIFYDRLVSSLGIKFCYTFDIAKSFKNQNINSSNE